MSNPTELPDLGQQRAILIVNEDGIELAIECRGDGKWQFASILNDRPHMSFARRAQPAGEAPQAEVYEVWNYAHECWSQTDKNGYLASHQNNRRIVPAATLSPLCGAQHAESGKELAAKPPFPISDDEMAALRRFWECATDGEGYDVEKSMMQRLAEIGLVQRKSSAYYMATDFGLYVLGECTIQRAAQLDGGQEGSGS